MITYTVPHGEPGYQRGAWKEAPVLKMALLPIVVVWLLVGVAAAYQRDYFEGDDESCAKLGTTAVTILAGPLNYVGANPKVSCELPQPSQ